ncbi:MAG: ATP phosphoribosyltransferase, partial [Beijerinckiaceae bacterium]
YINLTRRFFAAHGVGDYRIVESLGATEGAPAAGAAELIVDITTTGGTLEANALKVLDDGVMLKSQANLVASLAADWSNDSLAAARIVLGRIAAEHAARTQRQVRIAASAKAAEAALAAAFAAGARKGPNPGVVLAPADAAPAVADAALAAGADQVTVAELDYVFDAASPLYDRLAAAVQRKS